MVVVHNMLAANANRQLGIITDEKQKSTEKLSSGYRINRAADDAAGLSISEKLRWQIRGLNRGEKNTMDGISWCQVGDGALQEIEDMVQRIRELAVQASNDTNTESDRSAIDEEVVQLRKEINRSAYNTYFNGQHVFESKEASFGVWGTPNDLQVYTSNTKTGDQDINTVNYGGVSFVLNDTKTVRVPWSQIDSGMVKEATTADEDDTFHASTSLNYTWTDNTANNTDRYFTLTVADDGTDIPAYTRQITMTANNDGVNVDGQLIPWTDVLDEDGNSISENNLHDGVWTFDYYGATVGFYLSNLEDMDDVIREISEPVKDNKVYRWTVPYVGAASEQAVDASTNQKIPVENSMANTLDQNSLLYYVQADKDGIRLLDDNQNEVKDSLITWDELFAITDDTKNYNDWAYGTDFAEAIKNVLTYLDTNNDGDESYDTNLEVNFTLSDITGLDDVIEGMDGMRIVGTITNSYAEVDNDVDKSHGVSIDSTATYVDDKKKFHYSHISYVDERTLGRDFNSQTDMNVGTASLYYDYEDVIDSNGNTITLLTAHLDFKPDKTTQNYESNWNYDTVEMKGRFIVGGSETDDIDDIERQLMSGVASNKDGTGYVDDIVATKTYELLLNGTNVNEESYEDLMAGYRTGITVVAGSQNGSEFVGTISYDHRDLIHQIVVKMEANADGIYVKNTDGTDGYHEATADDDPNADRYSVKVTYAGQDTAEQMLKNHAATVMEYTVGATANATTGAQVQLNALDYTYTTARSEELPNSANRSLYESVVELREEPIGIHIQNSSNVGDYIIVSKMAMNTVVLGMFGANTKTYAASQQTIAACDNALSVLNNRRARFGSEQNRLEHTYRNSQNAEENQQSAESRIRDTDMAEEMVNNSKHDILQQAGQAMLAQANQNNQGILSLLQ